MDTYVFALVILFAVAIMDLVVGVSNDAVNFLNSSVGSRVAPRHTIMIVASLGILAGVTFFQWNDGGGSEKASFIPSFSSCPS